MKSAANPPLLEPIVVEPPRVEPTDSGWYLTSGPELPVVTMKGDTECDCLVIGAGWMGLHAARRFAELQPDDMAAGMSSPVVEILKRRTAPSRAYARIITSLGVKFVTGYRFRKAGKEV